MPKSMSDEIPLSWGICSLIKIFKICFKNGDIFKNIFGLLIKMKNNGFINIDIFRHT